MNKLVVVMCVVGLVTVTKAALFSVPLTNPGFESGFTGWIQNPLGAGSTIATTSDAYAGSLAALLRTDWQGGGGVKAEIYQTTPTGSVTPGTTYLFEIFVKGQMGVGGVAWAEIQWLDTDGSHGGGIKGGSGLINLFAGLSSTYQSKGGTYTAAAGADAAKVSIRCEGGAFAAVNTLYVDAIPEPASFGLAGFASLAILAVRRRFMS